MYRITFIIISVFCCQFTFAQNTKSSNYEADIHYSKRTLLHNGELSMEFPLSWKLNRKYPKYSNYEIRYAVEFADIKYPSFLHLEIYDTLFTPKLTIDSIINRRAILDLNDPQQAMMQILEKGKTKINGIEVGFIKYKFNRDIFNYARSKQSGYGIDFFFFSPTGIYYSLQLRIAKNYLPESKKETEIIFKSLDFEFWEKEELPTTQHLRIRRPTERVLHLP